MVAHRNVRVSRLTPDLFVIVVGLLLSIASGVIAFHAYGPYGEKQRNDPRVRRYYDAHGKLTLLVYDANGDGRLDTRSFMDGERLLRMELDANNDGIIDRWEEYGPGETLVRAYERAPDGTRREVAMPTLHNGR